MVKKIGSIIALMLSAGVAAAETNAERMGREAMCYEGRATNCPATPLTNSSHWAARRFQHGKESRGVPGVTIPRPMQKIERCTPVSSMVEATAG
jgi:hypothetical protein